MRKIYHVTKDENGWKGQVENAKRASVKGQTKKEVVDKTIEMAKKEKLSQVIIHNMDGQIQQERTYPRSSDPRDIKG